MTLLHITPPPVPVALTAEKVVAYLRAKGWTECPSRLREALIAFERPESGFRVWVPKDEHARDLAQCILAIARAENRPALDVAADIAGPVVGTCCAMCEDDLAPDYAWWNCIPSCGDCDDLSWFPTTAPACRDKYKRNPLEGPPCPECGDPLWLPAIDKCSVRHE